MMKQRANDETYDRQDHHVSCIITCEHKSFPTQINTICLVRPYYITSKLQQSLCPFSWCNECSAPDVILFSASVTVTAQTDSAARLSVGVYIPSRQVRSGHLSSNGAEDQAAFRETQREARLRTAAPPAQIASAPNCIQPAVPKPIQSAIPQNRPQPNKQS